ncbi:sensor histidine kinase [Paradesertivirga mongoliensis]|uniref:histidine kinase n=1 Tax=Paradesertivirga mongoliensis TaxID=2100740 RepID=A0ABW4ZHF0_9SPHI|nr:ATP-binding protein [Pedobacter mongoliensis]
MKLKTKFLLFSLVIHAVFIYLAVGLYAENRNSFFIAEALIMISLITSFWLYRSISRPFDIISSGIESLKDKDFSSKLNTVGHQEMDELISVYNLMIDQLRSERLQQIEKSSFLEKLIEASPSGIIILDFKGHITSVNPVAAQIIGQQQNVSGKRLEDLEGKLSQEIVSLELNASRVINLNGIKSYKCHKAIFIDKGYQRAFITIEELTREIYLKEKNAYEKVIKMMSHEVNNSIGAINSILNSCLNYKDQLVDDDRNDYANALSVSIKRNTNLSDVMSNFSKVIKVPEPTKLETDLVSLLRSVQILMEPAAKIKDVEWVWELESGEFYFAVDYQQMEQVFINIFKNAIEAVENAGKVSVNVSSGAGIITISNTGSGISKEVSDQLFSPFFSTKKNGQGIGLMLTREILYNHNLRFSLESDAHWTEFKIFFG